MREIFDDGCAVFVMLMAFSVGIALGTAVELSICRRSAAAAGVGEYKIDSKSGESFFHWKACK